MSYSIEWGQSCVHIKYLGHIISDDILEVRGRLSGDYRYDSIKYVITDFLDITSLTLSERDLKVIVFYHKTSLIWNTNIKLSILCNKGEILEVVLRYIDLLRIKGWKVKHFTNREKVVEWCSQK